MTARAARDGQRFRRPDEPRTVTRGAGSRERATAPIDSACPTLGPGVRRRCTICTSMPLPIRGDGPGGRFRRALLHEYAAGAVITCGVLQHLRRFRIGCGQVVAATPEQLPPWH